MMHLLLYNGYQWHLLDKKNNKIKLISIKNNKQL